MSASPSLVHRFAEFALTLINGKMEPIFAKHTKLFDQDWDEMTNRGETFEQWDAFKEYEAVLEKELRRFVLQEGYVNEREFMNEIVRLVEEDKVRVRKQLESLLQQLGALMNGQESASPMVMFYQPQGLEEMLNMVTNLAEYETFSMLMRARVQQAKLLKMVVELHGEVQKQLKIQNQPIDEKDIDVEEFNDDEEEEIL